MEPYACGSVNGLDSEGVELCGVFDPLTPAEGQNMAKGCPNLEAPQTRRPERGAACSGDGWGSLAAREGFQGRVEASTEQYYIL